MFIPELTELQELVDTINVSTATQEQVIAISKLRDTLRNIIDTFNVDAFIEGSSEEFNKLIENQQITDDILKKFGPFMTLYLLNKIK